MNTLQIVLVGADTQFSCDMRHHRLRFCIDGLSLACFKGVTRPQFDVVGFRGAHIESYKNDIGDEYTHEGIYIAQTIPLICSRYSISILCSKRICFHIYVYQ